MILTELKTHPAAYFVLITAIALFCFGFFSVWPNYTQERFLIVGFALFYFVWGVVLHTIKRQVTPRLISEYAVVSLIGCLLLLMLTF